MVTPDDFLRLLGARWPAQASLVEMGASDEAVEATLREAGADIGPVLRSPTVDPAILPEQAAGLLKIDLAAGVFEALDDLTAWLEKPGAAAVLVSADEPMADAVAERLTPLGYQVMRRKNGWVVARRRFGVLSDVAGPRKAAKGMSQSERLREERDAALSLAFEGADAARANERAAVYLAAALRRSQRDAARGLAEQKTLLTEDPAWAIGRAVLKARTLKHWLALPGKIAEARRAAAARPARAKATPAPVSAPTPLETGPRLATHAPEIHTLELQPDCAVRLIGRAIGPAVTRISPLTARVRYLDAQDRPIPTGDGSAQDVLEAPIDIAASRDFDLMLTPPVEARRLEIGLAAERGDIVQVTLTAIEQGPASAIRLAMVKDAPPEDQPPLIDRLRAIRDRPKLDQLNKAHAQVRRQVHHLKRRLLSLGFGEEAVQEFEQVIAETPSDQLRSLAAWELATWRANRYTPDDARDCLRLLEVVEASGELDDEWRRRIAILRAESLALTDQRDGAWFTLEAALNTQPHADLHLALTRLEADEAARLASVNQALALHGLEPAVLVDGEVVYDRLHAEAAPVEAGARVSIIIPAYNAEQTIGTAIRSLLEQTWPDIEILVSDDCSTDGTAAVVEAYAARDPRVRLIRGETNSGPYVARNHALKVATGDFVTCNDSDDWSHPRKIEMQARHLLEHPEAIANTSPQARTSEELVFHRRGNPGFYLQPNMSSLMFRREPAMEHLGYWDSIRFGADSEYLRRLKATFGAKAVVDLDCGPLSFQRQTETSLTGSGAFGYAGFKMGARRLYEENAKRFHRAADRLHIDFPLRERPFLAPEPMLPNRAPDREARRHFDVVLVSDFRLPGGTNMSNAEEIKAQTRMGLKTGLVELSVYHLNPDRALNGRILELIDGEQVEMLVHGEKISCDLLIVRQPWVLDRWQEYVPDIEAKAVRVIVNQPPQRDYAPGAERIGDIGRCAVNLERFFGRSGSWHPIGPLVRDALVTHHADEIGAIELGEIWPNIINVDEWRRPHRPERYGAIRIARHSRDQYVKWPDTAEDMLAVYPDDPRFQIHVLGGAESAQQVLEGPLPRNWRVKPFGKEHPRDFLARYDVFVYYTHPAWVESFGRVIFEAMAVGLPVFLPPVYEPLFKEAALYAEPHEVRGRIEALMADDDAYEAQVERAWAYVETHFGYAQHAIRLGAAMGRDLLPALQATPAASAA